MNTLTKEVSVNNARTMSRKNDWFIALGAIGFSVLFYKQDAGINFLLFSLLYASLNIAINRKKLTKFWYIAISIHLLCAWNVFYLNTGLSIFAWLFSLLYTIGKNFSMKRNSYLILNFFGLSSFVMSFEKLYENFFQKKSEKTSESKAVYIWASLISLGLVLIFLFLYKGANPLFDEFTNKINFKWLDIPFILLCIVGFYLLFSMIYPYFSTKSVIWDKQEFSELTLEDEDQYSSAKKLISLVAKMVFSCLNLMLLSLNYLDVKNIFILEKLPDNIFLSDFLHFSVWSIVFTIILAIILIVFIQRFRIKNKAIQILMYTLIFQSLIMVLDTFVRNYWYSFNQITYLRIGVFIFLSLCIFGLIYTAFSIYKKRNYWFLLNINLQTWFYVLILTSFFSWDRIITNFNLNFEKREQIDMAYLNSLSDNNLDLMLNFYQKHPKLFQENFYYFWDNSGNHAEKLAKRINIFNKKMKYSEWQSYSPAKLEVFRMVVGKK